MPNNVVRLVETNRDRDAVAIGELYRSAEQSVIQTAPKWLACGHRLKDKKRATPRGQWLPWLEVNADLLGFGEDAAQRMIKMAGKYRVNAVLAKMWQRILLPNCGAMRINRNARGVGNAGNMRKQNRIMSHWKLGTN
jgi:hypothetical protein